MSIDAVALLHASASKARKSAPRPDRVRRLGADACSIALFEGYLGLELRRGAAAALVRRTCGGALALHGDPRGVLLVPDADMPERTTKYEQWVELLEPSGFWVERDLLAQGGADLEALDDRDERAGGFLERLGGVLERDAGGGIVSVDLHNTRPSPEDISRLAAITTVRALDLRHVVTLTRGGLSELGKLASLERLALDELKIGDDDLELLSGLGRLAFLSVVRTRIRGVGFAALARLPALKELVIGYTPLDDAGLRVIAALPQLEALRLAPSNVTDAGVAPVARHLRLRVLDASRTRITDAIVAALLDAPALETVVLRGTALSDAAFERLRARPGLDIVR